MRLIRVLFLFSLIVSCAGPTNPFGGDVFISEDFKIDHQTYSSQENINFDFYPERQYYNSPYKLKIKIFDPNFDVNNFKYEIIYNHKRLNRWLKSETIKTPKNANEPIEITFDNLSILPGNSNQIAFLYYPAGSARPIIHELRVPECSDVLSNLKDADFSTNPFVVNNELKKTIKKKSLSFNYNPSLIAALIAQESSFDNHAISRAWALGLTQITPLAHREIKSQRKDWEIFPNFSELSIRTIRNYLKDKKINASNDWRLSPNKSIEGAILYLNYLKNYWSTPDKKEILEKAFSKEIPKTDIILASYNSGAYRVKKSIMNYGKEWLTSDQLGEARKYVMNIKSYCYSFKEGIHYEK